MILVVSEINFLIPCTSTGIMLIRSSFRNSRLSDCKDRFSCFQLVYLLSLFLFVFSAQFCLFGLLALDPTGSSCPLPLVLFSFTFNFHHEISELTLVVRLEHDLGFAFMAPATVLASALSLTLAVEV